MEIGNPPWTALVSSKTSPTGVEPSTPSTSLVSNYFNRSVDEIELEHQLIYSAAAASLVELIQDGYPGAETKEALRLMDEIPSLTKKIAGKSLPIEKLCSRKARKFHSQNHRLFLPAMELAYVFGSLSHTPRKSLLHALLPRIDKMLGTLEGVEPAEYGNGHEYWDGTLLLSFFTSSSILFPIKTPSGGNENWKG